MRAASEAGTLKKSMSHLTSQASSDMGTSDDSDLSRSDYHVGRE